MIRNQRDALTFSVAHFGFRRKPFQGNGVDFLSACPGYEETYARLLDGIRVRGLMLLVGEAGTGKTLLLKNLAHDPSVGLDVVLCEAVETIDGLLASVCKQLNVDPEGPGRPNELKALKGYIDTRSAEGVVLLIDDADKIDIVTLQGVINLAHLSSREDQPISVVLAGSARLEARINQLRIANPVISGLLTVRLKPLDLEQVAAFIQRQVDIAGCQAETLFPSSAVERIALHSQGIPRMVNTLCERALFLAEVLGHTWVSNELVDEAAAEILLRDQDSPGEAPENLATLPLLTALNFTAPAIAASALTTPTAPITPLPAIVHDTQPTGFKLLLAGVILGLLTGGLGVYFFQPRQEVGPAASLPVTRSGEGTDPLKTTASPAPPANPVSKVESPPPAERASTAPTVEPPPTPDRVSAAPPVESPPTPERASPAPAVEPPSTPDRVSAAQPPPQTVAPIPPATASLPITRQPEPPASRPIRPAGTASASGLTAADYRRNGERQLQQGDIVAARLFFEAAVDAGDVAAATAVGKTYDPLMISRWGIKGIRTDPVKAAEWYRQALQAGDAEANERLEDLRHWLAQAPALSAEQARRLTTLLQP